MKILVRPKKDDFFKGVGQIEYQEAINKYYEALEHFVDVQCGKTVKSKSESICEKETTLENFTIILGRAQGNTTRLVDHAIQIIFSGKICVVLDHHEDGRNNNCNHDLFRKVIDRLEHEHIGLLKNRNLKIDKSKLEIGLVKYSKAPVGSKNETCFKVKIEAIPIDKTYLMNTIDFQKELYFFSDPKNPEVLVKSATVLEWYSLLGDNPNAATGFNIVAMINTCDQERIKSIIGCVAKGENYESIFITACEVIAEKKV